MLRPFLRQMRQIGRVTLARRNRARVAAGAFAAAMLLLAPSLAGAQEAPAPSVLVEKQADTAAAAANRLKAETIQLMQAGRFAEAIPLAGQALQLSETVHGRDAVQTGVAAHNLGVALRRVGRVPEAQSHLERALAIYERTSFAVSEDTRNVAGELGQIYLAAGRGAEVVAIYERLIERAAREGFAGHVAMAHLTNNAGFVLRATGREADAERYWLRAGDLYEAQEKLDEASYGIALGALLDRYQSTRRMDEARALIESRLHRLEARGLGESKAVQRLLNRRARLEQSAGRYAEARDAAQAVLAQLDSQGAASSPDAIEPLNNLARSQRALGRYGEAEDKYKRAIAILDQQKDAANAGILSDNLAVLYGQIGKFEEAEPRHKRALLLLEQALGRGHREVGHAAANFGVMLNELGRYPEAEPLLRRGLAIAEAQKPADPVSVAIVLDNLSGLLRQTGRREEAMQTQRRALSLFEKGLPAEHPTLATARNNVGRLLLDLGRPAEAETELRRALDIAERLYGPDDVNTAVLTANLGEVHAALGQRGTARDLLQRALGSMEAQFGPEHARLMDTLLALGRLELVDSRPREARALFERAATIELALRSRTGGGARPLQDDRSGRRQPFFGLIEALWLSGGASDEEAARRALEIGQWASMTPAAVALAALGARAGAGDPALGALTRERQDLAAEWQAADRALTELLARTGDRNAAQETALRDRLAAAEARLGALDEELRKVFPRYDDLAKPAPLGAEAIQGLLHPREAALHYVVTPEATYLWAISKTKTRWLRLDVREEELGSLVRGLRCGLDRAEWTENGPERCQRLLGMPPEAVPRATGPLPFQPERAFALHSILLGGGADVIQGKDLLIVASGPLTSLPFQVLLTERPGAGASLAWLIRGHAMTVLPSLASLRSLRQFAHSSRATTPFLGVGNPLLTGENGTDRRAWDRQDCASTYKLVAEASANASAPKILRGGAGNVEFLRRQVPLPETADELCGVARYVGAEPENAVLLGANATEERIKALSRADKLSEARILHFATHGLLAGETEMFLASRAEPALMFTPPEVASETDNGLLTASEVATLKLDADWVVLSACNTAAGDQVGAEALSGLARAFFYAGARSLMVSHWAVDSDATVRLITGAFAAMEEAAGLSHAEALREAMLALIDSGGRESQPAFWAPFVVVGGDMSTSLLAGEVLPAGPIPPLPMRANGKRIGVSGSAPAPRVLRRKTPPASAANAREDWGPNFFNN